MCRTRFDSVDRAQSLDEWLESLFCALAASDDGDVDVSARGRGSTEIMVESVPARRGAAGSVGNRCVVTRSGCSVGAV